MQRRETRQPRRLLIETRIVFHRAGAERIDAGVDRIVLLREPRVMADDLRLAQPRQADLSLAPQAAEAVGYFRRRGQIDAAAPRSPVVKSAFGFEEQGLFVMHFAAAARGRREARYRFAPTLVRGGIHASASRSAESRASIL